MNFVKRAWKSICYRKIKVILQIIIFSVIFSVVISGLMMYATSNKMVENLRKTVANSITLKPILIIDKSKGAYMYYSVDPDDMSTFVDSKYIDSYNYYSVDYVNFKNIKKYVGDEEKYKELMEKLKNHTYFSDGTIYALVESAYDVAFTVNGYKLVEGRPITKEDSGKKVCLISQELADLNHLKLGDTIQATSTLYKPVEYSMTIVGIFSIPAGEYLTGTGTSPSEIIFMPNDTLNSYLSENGLKKANIKNVCVYLKNLSYIDDFINEVKNKINIRYVQESHFGNNIGQIPQEFEGWNPKDISEYYIKNHWYDLQIDREWYDMVAIPIENVNRITGLLVGGIVIGATLILTLLSILSLKGRKREFGVLLSIGERKWKIVGQVLFEEVIPMMVAAIIGLVIGISVGASYIKVLSENIYNQKTEEVLEKNQQIINGYMQEYDNLDDYGWNHQGAGDLIEKRSSRIIIQSNVDPGINKSTIIFYISTTFILVIIILALQMFFILRLKPARILTIKN